MLVLSEKRYLKSSTLTKEILVFSSFYVQKIYELQGRTRDNFPIYKLQATCDDQGRWKAKIVCGLTENLLWSSCDAIVYNTPDEALNVSILALKNLLTNDLINST